MLTVRAMNNEGPSGEGGASDDLSDAASEGRIEWRVIDEDGNDITDWYCESSQQEQH